MFRKLNKGEIMQLLNQVKTKLYNRKYMIMVHYLVLQSAILIQLNNMINYTIKHLEKVRIFI